MVYSEFLGAELAARARLGLLNAVIGPLVRLECGQAHEVLYPPNQLAVRMLIAELGKQIELIRTVGPDANVRLDLALAVCEAMHRRWQKPDLTSAKQCADAVRQLCGVLVRFGGDPSDYPDAVIRDGVLGILRDAEVLLKNT